ncbi:MAG: HIT domain-containing protein [Alphaproteobacteria bacterium]|nr:HIT domain-containing protein [Alphaproteobacteria bacterium]
MFENKYDADNVFAQILSGKKARDKFAENEHAIAIPTIRPEAPFHILIIPKGPYANIHHFIRTASQAEQMGFWKLVADVAEMAKMDGFNVWVNTGESHGQGVMHFHAHVLADKKMLQCQ